MVVAMVAAACGGDDDAEAATTAIATTPTTAGAATTEPSTDATDGTTGTVPSTTGPEAAAPTTASSEQELSQLIEAAQREGELNWYGALGEPQNAAVSQAFEEAYGIKTTFTRLSSTDLWQRFTSELDAGAPTADLIMTASTAVLDDGLEDGLITPVTAANIPGFPVDILPPYIDDNRQSVRVAAPPLGIAYNTDLVPEDEAPKSWEDLLDPKWKGQIIFNSPATADSILDFYRFIDEQYGDEFLASLVAQQNRVMDGGLQAMQAIGAGEAAISIPGSFGGVGPLQAQGAPVDITFPTPTIAGEVVIYPTANAAHPNAALLFTHFMMSQEGNAAFNALATFSGTTSVSDGGPDNLEFYSSRPATDDERAHILGIFVG